MIRFPPYSPPQLGSRSPKILIYLFHFVIEGGDIQYKRSLHTPGIEDMPGQVPTP